MEDYLKTLLALTLVVGMTACSKPPESTAANRDEAFEQCFAKLEPHMEQIDAERELAEANPEMADWETNKSYYNDFNYAHLLSDEYDKVTILRSYCKPRKLSWKGHWAVNGFVEYLVQPTDAGEAHVDRTLLTYDVYYYSEESKRLFKNWKLTDAPSIRLGAAPRSITSARTASSGTPHRCHTPQTPIACTPPDQQRSAEGCGGAPGVVAVHVTQTSVGS